MNTFSFVCVSLVVSSLLAGAGCARELPSDSAEVASAISVAHGDCSKPLAKAVRDEIDNNGDLSLVLVPARELPAAAKAKLKALNDELKKHEAGFSVDPYKFESAAGTAFVLFYAGSDDDGAIVEVYSTSGKRLLTGDSPCGCEPIDWTDSCAAH